jgi:hypothetical protein
MEIKLNINTGRPTVVTSMGDEIDVISFIANAWKHDPTLVTKGLYEAENVPLPLKVVTLKEVQGILKGLS